MPFTQLPPEKRALLDELRSYWTGPYIGNGNYTAETGAQRISDNKATAITYGRFFLANPDLPERFRRNAELNELDVNTFYGGDHKGYTDYPFLNN